MRGTRVPDSGQTVQKASRAIQDRYTALQWECRSCHQTVETALPALAVSHSCPTTGRQTALVPR